jgi:hypothetical protein
VQAAFEDSQVVTTAILGGSLSYGRFYNTCGGTGKPSDIDLLLIIRDDDDLPTVAERLATLEFVQPASVEELGTRIELFNGYRRSYEPCIFRHKLKLWEDHPHDYALRHQVPAGKYLLGLHVVTQLEFDYLTLRDVPILEEREFERRVFEYRDDRPPRDFEEARSFAGIRRTTAVQYETVERGAVTDGLVCLIEGGWFYPGVHLNIILPRFEVRWESPGMRIRLRLLNLEWKLRARLEDERCIHRMQLSLSQSHTRSNLFSRRVTRSVDASS